VIGSGGIARRRTIPEGILKANNSALSVVFDINAQVNSEVAKKFGVKQTTSIGSLLRTDIDAVYIATPAHLHAEQVRACYVCLAEINLEAVAELLLFSWWCTGWNCCPALACEAVDTYVRTAEDVGSDYRHTAGLLPLVGCICSV